MDQLINFDQHFERELADLKKQFGVKKIISPEELAPIIGKSIATLANMRSKGICPIPAKKIGRSVGFYIGDVASWLVTGGISIPDPDSQSITYSPPKITKPKPPKKVQEWMSAMQLSIDLNQRLVVGIERYSLQQLSPKSKTDNKKRLRPTP